MSRYFDRQGKPMEMLEWAKAFEQWEKKQIAFDKLPSVDISTVWLGMDHQFGDGPPLIFETMVFGGKLDGECERYSTEEDAVVGHQAMVDKVREAEAVKISEGLCLKLGARLR